MGTSTVTTVSGTRYRPLQVLVPVPAVTGISSFSVLSELMALLSVLSEYSQHYDENSRSGVRSTCVKKAVTFCSMTKVSKFSKVRPKTSKKDSKVTKF